MAELKHGFASTNGIKMHYVEVGAGPLVVLCHGWPESWYSWRHQLPALAEAGFRVVAPDQRGYGQTDKPEAIEAYNILNLVSDIVGLASDPLIVPNPTSANTVYSIAHLQSSTIENFDTYDAFVTQLQTELNGTTLVTGLTAVGQYTAATFSLAATSITLSLNN